MYLLAIFLDMLLSLLGVLRVVGKMPFFILSVRICIALLTFPLLISRENLLDIPVMLVNVFFDLKLFWIVSVYFNNSSKSRDIHDSGSISKAFK